VEHQVENDPLFTLRANMHLQPKIHMDDILRGTHHHGQATKDTDEDTNLTLILIVFMLIIVIIVSVSFAVWKLKRPNRVEASNNPFVTFSVQDPQANTT
jgi:hypothetical protein